MAFSSRRGVVGLVNPTMRPGPTEELIRLLPEGIGVIPLFLNIREGTTAEFKRVVASYEPQVALLAEQKCDLIHLIGAPPFMVLGRKAETKLVAAWQRKYRTPIFTVPQNHVAALKALGAKSIVGATYFPAKLNAIFARILARRGLQGARPWTASTCRSTRCRSCPSRQIYAHIKRSFRQAHGRRRDLHARLRLAHARHHRKAGARSRRAGGASGHRARLGNSASACVCASRSRATGDCWKRCRDGRGTVDDRTGLALAAHCRRLAGRQPASRGAVGRAVLQGPHRHAARRLRARRHQRHFRPHRRRAISAASSPAIRPSWCRTCRAPAGSAPPTASTTSPRRTAR